MIKFKRTSENIVEAEAGSWNEMASYKKALESTTSIKVNVAIDNKRMASIIVDEAKHQKHLPKVGSEWRG